MAKSDPSRSAMALSIWLSSMRLLRPDSNDVMDTLEKALRTLGIGIEYGGPTAQHGGGTAECQEGFTNLG